MQHSVDAIIELIQRLVQTPSRGGVDPHDPILNLLGGWFSQRNVAVRELTDPEGRAVGLACELDGTGPGRHLVLNACVDTAPYGDASAWRFPPTSAHVEEGWLYGRGSADSKAAVAIFAHLAAEFAASPPPGRLSVVFDADEHTGGFAGARAYFEDESRRVDGVMIGYPGDAHVVIGARGFLRAEIRVHGTAGHSGASAPAPGNAVHKAARLVDRLTETPLREPVGESFPLPPKLTVTAMHGGEGYATIPDRCVLFVDLRLTPEFPVAAARSVLVAAVQALDDAWPTEQPTTIDLAPSWPAYRLDAGSRLARDLLAAARRHSGQHVEAKIAGPSNIANYLASLGIEATCGFGVRYRNLHATDECIDLATVAGTYRAYQDVCSGSSTT